MPNVQRKPQPLDMTGEAKEAAQGVLDAFRDRLKDHLLAAYAVAFVADNWQPLYRLIRSHGPTDAVIRSVGSFDAVVPLFYAVAFAVLYPVARALQAVFADGVAIEQNNLSRWWNLRKLLTIAELRDHDDYRYINTYASAMREHISQAWRLFAPHRSETVLVHVFRVEEPIKAPCFVLNGGQDIARRIVKPDPNNPGAIIFAFANIGTTHLVVAMNGALVPWPEHLTNVEALSIDTAAETKTYIAGEVPEPKKLVAAGVLGIVRRLPDKREWGRFEIEPGRPQPIPSRISG